MTIKPTTPGTTTWGPIFGYRKDDGQPELPRLGLVEETILRLVEDELLCMAGEKITPLGGVNRTFALLPPNYVAGYTADPFRAGAKEISRFQPEYEVIIKLWDENYIRMLDRSSRPFADGLTFSLSPKGRIYIDTYTIEAP